jgi:hypothetical protein
MDYFYFKFLKNPKTQRRRSRVKKVDANANARWTFGSGGDSATYTIPVDDPDFIKR